MAAVHPSIAVQSNWVQLAIGEGSSVLPWGPASFAKHSRTHPLVNLLQCT